MEEERGGFEFDERFAEAFIHVPGGHRVMGKRLRPFCAWHRLQLEYLNNAFVLDGERPEPGDLRLAVAVCRTVFPETIRLKGAEGRRGWWGKVLRVHRARCDARERESGRFLRQVALFRLYLADYMSLPVLYVNKKSSGGTGKGATTEGMRVPDMDETLTDVALYRNLTGCGRVEAWSIPLGELVWMTAAGARIKGLDLRITTTAEEARLQKYKERRDAVKFKKEEKK